jgi:hypothetical protein
MAFVPMLQISEKQILEISNYCRTKLLDRRKLEKFPIKEKTPAGRALNNAHPAVLSGQ